MDYEDDKKQTTVGDFQTSIESDGRKDHTENGDHTTLLRELFPEDGATAKPKLFKEKMSKLSATKQRKLKAQLGDGEKKLGTALDVFDVRNPDKIWYDDGKLGHGSLIAAAAYHITQCIL